MSLLDDISIVFKIKILLLENDNVKHNKDLCFIAVTLSVGKGLYEWTLLLIYLIMIKQNIDFPKLAKNICNNNINTTFFLPYEKTNNKNIEIEKHHLSTAH